MNTARRAWIPALTMGALLFVFGCQTEDGGVTDPEPVVCNEGDIVVKPDADGTMKPLQDAVNTASAGAFIQVQAGIYKGQLIIDKPVRLQGCSGKDHTLLTHTSDSTAVVVRIPASTSATDSLLLLGFSLSNAGRGMAVDTSGATIALIDCAVSGNSSTGIQVGDASGPPAGNPTLSLSRCFFSRNGILSDAVPDPGDKSAIWVTTKLDANTVITDENRVDVTLSNGATGTLARLTSGNSLESAVWLQGGSSLELLGDGGDNPSIIGPSEGWAGRVEGGSRLRMFGHFVTGHESGGILNEGSTLVLDNTELNVNQNFGIRSIGATDSLTSATVFGTRWVQSTNGHAIYKDGTGSNLLHIRDSAITGNWLNGIVADGAISVDIASSLVSSNGVVFSNNPIIGVFPRGGGLRLLNGASATIASTTMGTNFAFDGGAIAVLDDQSSVQLNNATLRANTSAVTGGGLSVSGGTATIASGTLEGNSSMNEAGAVYVAEGGTLTATGSTLFASNSAVFAGGVGTFIDATVNISDGAILINNRCSTADGGIGGALYVRTTNLTLEDSFFESNRSFDGGALYFDAMTVDVSVERCEFTGNSTPNNAPVVYAKNLTRNLTFRDCLLAQNRLEALSDTAANAVFSQQDIPGGRVILEGCTVAENTGGAGAIAHRSGEMVISQSIVAFNAGGGLFGTDLQFVQLSCNDFYSNSGFNYGLGTNVDPLSISEDPLFCDPGNLIYSVDASSPVLASNNSCGSQIGAFGQGCSNVP